jgi:hypothetical protein
MKPIKNTEVPIVLRTDFSDQSVWERICAEIRKPVGFFRFRANVEFLDQAEYAGITKDCLLALLSPHYDHSFIIVADQTAILQTEHPLQVIDLFDQRGREFRAVPSQVQAIENNLSIANMDFEEFAGSVGEDGVFRGFPHE